MEPLLSRLLANSDVVIELAGFPPLVISLDPGPASAPPNALLSALRPAVTLRASGVKVLRSAPYGEPSQGAPWGVVIAMAAAAGAIVVCWAVLR